VPADLSAVAKTGRPRSCECGQCKTCRNREYMRAWWNRKTLDQRRAHIARRDPESVKQSDRRRYLKRKGTPAQIANYLLNNAIRDGHIVRGPCEVCGTRRHVDGHHDDYSKPLDARWMCRRHHLEFHAAARSAVAV
jgi:hypothetical protein